MAKTFLSFMGKPIQIRQGFTLLEMLIVLVVVMCLGLCAYIPYQKLQGSTQAILYQLEILIENARFEALESQSEVDINFLANRICVKNDCYFQKENISIKEDKVVTFNENGNISQGTHVDIEIKNQIYRIIFNVGRGAYRIEKNSFCLAGLFICPLYFFVRHHRFIFGKHFIICSFL